MALQSESGITDGRSSLLAFARGFNRAVFCLEVIARCAAVDHKTELPDW